MANHNRIGEIGENLASKRLEEIGFEIVQKNWREHRYEIDIIAKINNQTHFVEVKTRNVLKTKNGGTDFLAENAITNKKLKHLIEGVQYYVDSNKIEGEIYLNLMAVDFFDDGTIDLNIYYNINE